jgi:hypothetical protein
MSRIYIVFDTNMAHASTTPSKLCFRDSKLVQPGWTHNGGREVAAVDARERMKKNRVCVAVRVPEAVPRSSFSHM